MKKNDSRQGYDVKSVGFRMLMCLVTILLLGLNACSDDDDKTVVPVFPDKTETPIVCGYDVTVEFEFEANTAWTLSSSASWCKFVSDGMEMNDISGEAGKHTVTIKVVQENPNFTSDKASLTLRMNGEQKVIAEVERPGKERSVKILKVTDEGDVEIQTIEAGYGQVNTLKMVANFAFIATFPDYIEIQFNGDMDAPTIIGEANEEVTFGIRVRNDNDQIKYPITVEDEQFAEIADQTDESAASVTKNITFEGMKPDVLNMVSSYYFLGWNVSLDGEMFSVTDAEGKNRTEIGKTATLTVQCLNDDFEILVAKEWQGDYYLEDKANTTITVTKGENGQFSVEAGQNWQKTIYRIYALPRAVYETFEGKEDNESPLSEDIVDSDYLVMQITQEDISTGNGVRVTTADGRELACDLFTETNPELQDAFGDAIIYMITDDIAPGDNILIYPGLSEDDWWGQCTDENGADIAGIGEPSFYPETVVPFNNVPEGETKVGFAKPEGNGYSVVFIINAW